MAFTVNDFRDLIALLEARPDWRAELRRLVLSDELLRLPEEMRELTAVVRDLAEQMRRSETRLVQVEERLGEVEVRLDKVEERLDKAEVRLGEVEVRLGEVEVRLGEVEVRLDKVEERLGEVEVRLDKVEERLGKVEVRLERVENQVGDLRGNDLERRVRERPHIYLGKYVRRARLISDDDLFALLNEAMAADRITDEQANDVERLDAVVEGQAGERKTYLAIEVSSTVSDYDVERVVRRAAALERALQQPVRAVVVGAAIPEALRQRIEAEGGGWALAS
jgi:chromosome segregation ATPase